MRIFTLALFSVVSPAINAQVPTSAAVRIHVSPSLCGNKNMVAERQLWLPSHDVVYTPDGESGWTKSHDVYYTYDSRGNVLSQITDDGSQKTCLLYTSDAADE